MTNQERLLSLLGFQPPENAMEGELIDAGLTGNSTYDKANLNTLKKAAINLMWMLLSTPDTSSENWNTIKYDRDAILKRIKAYEQDVGITTGLPTIRGKQPW